MALLVGHFALKKGELDVAWQNGDGGCVVNIGNTGEQIAGDVILLAVEDLIGDD